MNLSALKDVPNIIEGLNSVSVTDDTFKVFEKLGSINASKISELSSILSEAGANFMSFKDTLSQLQDIEDAGNILTSFLEDLTDIDGSEVDALAVALENLAKSYIDLSSAMANITDIDIEKMKSINDNIGFGTVAGGLMSGISKLFGSNDDDTAIQESQVTQATPGTITPVMQPVASVNTQPIVQTNQTINTDNTQPNFKNVEALLKELISKVEQPVVLKIGEKAISEMQSVMSLKKSYSSNVNGYRA